MNSTVLTEQTIIRLKHAALNQPGTLNHQASAASAATISSTYIPATSTATRRQRLLNIQASETLQYRHGTNTNSWMPNSWHSPPKRRQQSAWASSCSVFTTATDSASQPTLRRLKKAWKSGSRRATCSAWTANRTIAASIVASAAATAQGENNQRQ